MTAVAYPNGYYVSKGGGLSVSIKPEDAAPRLTRAACYAHPTEPAESWTTDERTIEATDARRRARVICRTECLSRRACEAFATRTKQLGIWGGTSAADRNEVR